MVLEKVKAILCNQFDVEEDTITTDTRLEDDLGADSLDVEIQDEDIEKIHTVGDLVSYIEEHM